MEATPPSYGIMLFRRLKSRVGMTPSFNMLRIPERELVALSRLAANSVEYVLNRGCAMQHYGVERLALIFP
jgi:hypothetical protein